MLTIGSVDAVFPEHGKIQVLQILFGTILNKATSIHTSCISTVSGHYNNEYQQDTMRVADNVKVPSQLLYQK